MIDIEGKIIHRDIFLKNFCCDICKCKGICCVEGDSGAPLEQSEEQKIQEILPIIYNDLSIEARTEIDKNGISMIDVENELTTTICKDSGACVFAKCDDDGIIYCVIEKAYEKGLSDFRKPISCHLYPVRVKKYQKFDAVNYNVWDICSDAISCGNEKNIKIYEFLKDALIRKYGTQWYEQVCIAAEYIKFEN